MVARTRLSVALYVRCWSCSLLLPLECAFAVVHSSAGIVLTSFCRCSSVYASPPQSLTFLVHTLSKFSTYYRCWVTSVFVSPPPPCSTLFSGCLLGAYFKKKFVVMEVKIIQIQFDTCDWIMKSWEARSWFWKFMKRRLFFFCLYSADLRGTPVIKYVKDGTP